MHVTVQPAILVNVGEHSKTRGIIAKWRTQKTTRTLPILVLERHNCSDSRLSINSIEKGWLCLL